MARTKRIRNFFKEQDILLHNRENKFFVVQAKDYMDNKKDWLYTLKLVGNGTVEQYKRCYQEALGDKYSQVKNAETIKLIYGKS